MPLVISSLIIGGSAAASAQDIAMFDEVKQAVTALRDDVAFTPSDGDVVRHPENDADRVWAEALILLQNLIARTQADNVLEAAQDRLASAIDTAEAYLVAEVTVVTDSDDTVAAEPAPLVVAPEPDDSSNVDSRQASSPVTGGLDSRLTELQLQACEIQCALERWIVDVEALQARQDDTAVRED